MRWIRKSYANPTAILVYRDVGYMKGTIEVNGLDKFTLYVGGRAFVEYTLTKLLRGVIKRLLLHNICRKVKRMNVERFDRKEDKAEVLNILDFFPSLAFLSYKPYKTLKILIQTLSQNVVGG